MLLPALALVAGPFLLPAAAPAQCRLCDQPTTEVTSPEAGEPVRLEVQARLDFDQLVVMDGTAPGSVRLLPDGTSNVSGSVSVMSGRAMVGHVIIRGEPGRLVRIGLPAAIQLHSPTGASIRVDSLVTDLAGTARLDAQGSLQFRFGGALHINGAVEGDYRGDVPITVDYL